MSRSPFTVSLSSLALTVTVLAMFQLPELKYSVDGLVVRSGSSLRVVECRDSRTVTLPMGWWLSFTLYLALPPSGTLMEMGLMLSSS